MKRSLVVVVLSLATLALAATPATADHSWGGYHWAGAGDRTPVVVDKTAANDPGNKFDVADAVAEWSALNTPMKPVMGSSGSVEVIAKKGSAQWIGLAQVSLSGGHIVAGRVTLNSLYYGSYSAAEWDYVVCQELGHVWGLDHVDEVFGNADQGTCMDYTNNMAQNNTPNAHDAEQLNAIYAHGDTSGGGSPPNCKNPNKPGCQNPQGKWVTVHVFWAR